MKFLKWYLTKFLKETSIWGWMYFFACGFIGTWGATSNKLYIYIAGILMGGILLRWTVFESIKNSYNEYVKERNELFVRIKNSDK